MCDTRLACLAGQLGAPATAFETARQLQQRLARPSANVASLRSLAKDLLAVTQEDAAAAIQARLHRATDLLAAATDGDCRAGRLAEVTDVLRIAMQPTVAEAT